MNRKELCQNFEDWAQCLIAAGWTEPTLQDLAAVLIVEKLCAIEQRLDKIEDRLIEVAHAVGR